MESKSINLKTWVSDKVMTLVGYSQPIIVQHIIAVAKQATSPAGVVDMLVESGWSSTPENTSLAQEIFYKFPHKTSSVLDQNIKPARDFRRKRYDLVEGDEDEEKETTQTRVKKSRTRLEDEEEEDQRAREKLERNLKEKDKAATRKLTEPKPNRRRSPSNGDHHDIEKLRILSRNKYMEKRAKQTLDEIRDEIRDEKMLFEYENLTEEEKRRIKYKEKVCDIVKKYEVEGEDVNEYYKIPEAYDDMKSGVNQKKRYSAALQRYREEEVKKAGPKTEQDA